MPEALRCFCTIQQFRADTLDLECVRTTGPARQVERRHAGRQRRRARGGCGLPQAHAAAVVLRKGRAAAQRAALSVSSRCIDQLLYNPTTLQPVLEA